MCSRGKRNLKKLGLAISALGICVSTFSACSSETSGGPAASLFVVPDSLDALTAEHFYDHPWPSDLRRDTGGGIHLAGLYDPHQTVLIRTYLDALKGVIKGFSPVAMGYLRFAGDVDPASLPATPTATLDAHASVQLVDVDPASPE